MEQLQKTFDGRLLKTDTVKLMRYIPEAPIYRYFVEFSTEELVETVVESVYIEDRDIDGVSPKERAICAAIQQSFWDDLELIGATKWKKIDGNKSDEHLAEEYMEEYW